MPNERKAVDKGLAALVENSDLMERLGLDSKSDLSYLDETLVQRAESTAARLQYVIEQRNGLRKQTIDAGEDDKNPYQVEHDEFFASIQNGGVINNAEYGATSTMTAILGRMATYSGKIITWKKALNSDQVLVPDEKKLTWASETPAMPDENGNYEVPVPGKTKIL